MVVDLGVVATVLCAVGSASFYFAGERNRRQAEAISGAPLVKQVSSAEEGTLVKVSGKVSLHSDAPPVDVENYGPEVVYSREISKFRGMQLPFVARLQLRGPDSEEVTHEERAIRWGVSTAGVASEFVEIPNVTPIDTKDLILATKQSQRLGNPLISLLINWIYRFPYAVDKRTYVLPVGQHITAVGKVVPLQGGGHSFATPTFSDQFKLNPSFVLVTTRSPEETQTELKLRASQHQFASTCFLVVASLLFGYKARSAWKSRGRDDE